jgi:hypothetical protein
MGNCRILGRWASGGIACWAMLAGWAMAQNTPAGSSASASQNALAPLPSSFGQSGQTTSGTPAAQTVPASQYCPQNSAPAQAFPPICCADPGPAKWPPACCPPALETSVTKDFGYYLNLPRMTFYTIADGMALQRLPRTSVDFAVNGPGETVLSTSDFNYDYQAAGRILVGATLGDCFQVEGLYWRMTTGEDTEAVRDTTTNGLGGSGDLFSPFGGFGVSPITGVDYMNFAQIRYTSSLQDAEINLRRAVPMPEGRLAVSILIGARYMGLPEELDFNTTTATPAPGATNNFRVNTDNQMYGAQVGSLMEFYVDNRWWINFEFKAAVMNDYARVATFYENISTAGVTSNFVNSTQENHTAFAEDVSVVCVYHWSEHITTRFGWQGVFMQGVALAPDNVGTSLPVLTLGPAQLNHSGATVYQGPVAGLTLAW